MKHFDHNGVLLAEFQGKIFEKSSKLDISTPIFMRRFLHSDLLKKLELNNAAIILLDENLALDEINEQFTDTKYGKIKYSSTALFWIGYFYRYVAYTRETTTNFVMSIFPYEKLNELYYSFHTQDMEWCLNSILDLYSLNEKIFDVNYRLKELIKEKGMY